MLWEDILALRVNLNLLGHCQAATDCAILTHPQQSVSEGWGFEPQSAASEPSPATFGAWDIRKQAR
jgi:hypothetical protein